MLTRMPAGSRCGFCMDDSSCRDADENGQPLSSCDEWYSYGVGKAAEVAKSPEKKHHKHHHEDAMPFANMQSPCPCTLAKTCSDCTQSGDCGWCTKTFNDAEGTCMVKDAVDQAEPEPEHDDDDDDHDDHAVSNKFVHIPKMLLRHSARRAVRTAGMDDSVLCGSHGESQCKDGFWLEGLCAADVLAIQVLFVVFLVFVALALLSVCLCCTGVMSCALCGTVAYKVSKKKCRFACSRKAAVLPTPAAVHVQQGLPQFAYAPLPMVQPIPVPIHDKL